MTNGDLSSYEFLTVNFATMADAKNDDVASVKIKNNSVIPETASILSHFWID